MIEELSKCIHWYADINYNAELNFIWHKVIVVEHSVKLKFTTLSKLQ